MHMHAHGKGNSHRKKNAWKISCVADHTTRRVQDSLPTIQCTQRVRACLASHGRRGKSSSNRDQVAACIPGQRETGRSQRSEIQPNNASVDLPHSEASTRASGCRLNSDSYTSQRCRRSVIPEPRECSGGLRQLYRTCPQKGVIHWLSPPT